MCDSDAYIYFTLCHSLFLYAFLYLFIYLSVCVYVHVYTVYCIVYTKSVYFKNSISIIGTELLPPLLFLLLIFFISIHFIFLFPSPYSSSLWTAVNWIWHSMRKTLYLSLSLPACVCVHIIHLNKNTLQVHVTATEI